MYFCLDVRFLLDKGICNLKRVWRPSLWVLGSHGRDLSRGVAKDRFKDLEKTSLGVPSEETMYAKALGQGIVRYNQGI